MVVALDGVQYLFIQEYGCQLQSLSGCLLSLLRAAQPQRIQHEIHSTRWAMNVVCSIKETWMTFRANCVSGISRILFTLQSSGIWISLAAMYQTTRRQTQENHNLNTDKRSTTFTPYYVAHQLACLITQGRGLGPDTERYVIFFNTQTSIWWAKATKLRDVYTSLSGRATHTTVQPEGLQTLQVL